MPIKKTPKINKISLEVGAQRLSELKPSEQDPKLSVLHFITQQSELNGLISGLPPYLQKLIEADFCTLWLLNGGDNPHSPKLLYGQLEQNASNIEIPRFDKNEQTDFTCCYEEIRNDLSLLHVALRVNQKTIGVISFGRKEDHNYDASQIESIAEICNLLALMIDRLQQQESFKQISDKLVSVITERGKDSQVLMNIVEGVGAEIGNNFFRSVVEHLSSALNVRYAFVGELVNNGTKVETKAVWRGNQLIENFDYNVEGATGDACADKVCYCCHSVKKLMPDAELQRIMRVESCWALPLNNSNDETIGVLVVMHDGEMEREENIIPVMKIFAARSGPELERVRTEEILFKEKERAQVTLSSIADGVITTDANGIVEYINPNAERMMGWCNKEAQGLPIQKVFNIIDESTRMSLIDSVVDSIKGEFNQTLTSSNIILIKKDGMEIPVSNSISPIRDHNDRILGNVIVFNDISSFRNLMEQVSFQASHDEMTGLINRRELEKLLVSHIETCHSQHKSHVLLYIDLDRFKIVNDTCGHVAGDELLKQVSALMNDSVRENDYVARIGGDEFAILLQGCPIDIAEQIAEKIRQRIKDHKFAYEGKIFEVGASIGLMPITKDSGDLSVILSSADAACYMAKELGKNNVYVYSSDDMALNKYKGEVQWSHRIYEAIEKDQFCLYHQKILRLTDNKQNNEFYEVLLRLKDNDGSIISPMAFIPVAERLNLMTKIDRWVIKKVFEHLYQKKCDLGEEDYCTINLSGQSLGDPEVLDEIMSLSEELNINSKHVCFEITETAAIENLSKAKFFINKLKKIGFLFALDDFGTGMSSFSYLKNLPVDYLKIDGEFIKDISINDVDSIMVDSINRIGKSMGMKTIAEFVENKKTIEHLRNLNIDYAQGYGIAKPAPLTIEQNNNIQVIAK